MLRTLRVRDLAIIDELELQLEPGLNVITGETGAGKSILLQALDVALGGRPDADLVRTGAEEGSVEAQFVNLSAAVRERLTAAGIPAPEGQDELLVRRVIARGGRTRAYVNGALGSLAVLRELAPHLVHAYGQDEHQALRRVESHRELLDATGGLGRTLGEEMRTRHGRFVAAREAIARHRADTEAAVERAEMLRAQSEELVRAGLTPGEEEALAAVREAAGLDAGLGATRTLLESALAELEEAGQNLGRYARELTPDGNRLEAVDERLAQLARLKRKYAGTVEDLIRRRDELVAELDQLAGGS